MFKRRKAAVFCVVIWMAVSATQADDVLDQAFGVKKVAGGCKFTEGPAVDGDGNLFFSDGQNDRIMRLAPNGELTVFRKPCGRTNGMLFDHEGRLLMCQSCGEGGRRRVARP